MIAPSLLSANFMHLGDEIDSVLNAGADLLHFDVMDNHYVPNLTIGPLVCESIKKSGITAPIDVHLMCKPVDALIESFAAAGADIITFHPDASTHVDRSLALIKSLGCKAGLVFNPASPIHYLDYCMDKLDMILLMTVNPGFGGQKLIQSVLPKIAEVRKKIDASGLDIRLEVDGGINRDTIVSVAEAGADTFVMGSAIFNAPNIQDVISEARSLLATVS